MLKIIIDFIDLVSNLWLILKCKHPLKPCSIHYHINLASVDSFNFSLTAWFLNFLSTAQCPAGKFSSDGLGPLCRVCPKNSYQDQTGETACKNCKLGTKTLQLAAISAEACGGNVTIRAYLETYLQLVLELKQTIRIVFLSSCSCDYQCELQYKRNQQRSHAGLFRECVSVNSHSLAFLGGYSKWENRLCLCSSCSVIVRSSVVLKRTVVGDWRFDNLSGGHLQSQVNSVCGYIFWLVAFHQQM